jgi:hypothetical protein
MEVVLKLADAGHWRSWTVSGAGIYYVADAAQPPYKIKFYDLASGATNEAAATDKKPLWVNPSLSTTTDGETVLYAQNNQNASSIMLAELAHAR